MCALSAVAFVVSLAFTKNISLERALETDQAFIHDRKAAATPDVENVERASG
jgi:hypothetical protein